jgi:hypothetical protein
MLFILILFSRKQGYHFNHKTQQLSVNLPIQVPDFSQSFSSFEGPKTQEKAVNTFVHHFPLSKVTG